MNGLQHKSRTVLNEYEIAFPQSASSNTVIYSFVRRQSISAAVVDGITKRFTAILSTCIYLFMCVCAGSCETNLLHTCKGFKKRFDSRNYPSNIYLVLVFSFFFFFLSPEDTRFLTKCSNILIKFWQNICA